MRFFLLCGLILSTTAQASLLSSKLNYDHYQDWRPNDLLYYSTFNHGEQWKNWKTYEYEVTRLNLVDQMNLCYSHGGGWNYFLNDCVIEDEAQLLSYLEAMEEAERFGFHFSAPALQPVVYEDYTKLSLEEVDWENYETWSPEKQLYFSTMGQGEMNGEMIRWELD